MEVFGNRDTRISDYRKCWIATKDVTIVGLWGPGTSMEITSSWHAPFESEHLGAKAGALGSMFQAVTSWTMISTFNTRQVWTGNQPTKFSLELKLYALTDPELEVMRPLRELERMIAPNTSMLGPGAIPEVVDLNIGTKIIYADMIIESISVPFDKEMDSKGRFVRATVTLALSTPVMVSKALLEKGYGLAAQEGSSSDTATNNGDTNNG